MPVLGRFPRICPEFACFLASKELGWETQGPSTRRRIGVCQSSSLVGMPGVEELAKDE
jgi:hypothetical protein